MDYIYQEIHKNTSNNNSPREEEREGSKNVMVSLMCYLVLAIAASSPAVDAHDHPAEKPKSPHPKAADKCKSILYNMFISEKKPELNTPILKNLSIYGLESHTLLRSKIITATKSELESNPLLYNMFVSQTNFLDIDLLYDMILARMDKPRLFRSNTAIYNMFLTQFLSGGFTKSNPLLYYMFLGKLKTGLKDNTELFNMFISEAKAGKTNLIYHMFLANMILAEIKPALKSNTLLYNMIVANAVVCEKENGIKATRRLTDQADTEEVEKVPAAEGLAKPTNKPLFSFWSQNQ